MPEAFQRGEDVIWPFLVTDEDGGIINLTGGNLTVEIWWRGIKRITLGVGSGLTITSSNPPVGNPQTPHGFAKLSAAQTATIPQGRIAKVQSRFVDTLGAITLSPFAYLDDAIGPNNHEIVFAGRQGPSGVFDITTILSLPLIDALDADSLFGAMNGSLVRIDPGSLLASSGFFDFSRARNSQFLPLI